MSLLNHVIDVHIYKNNKIFVKCTHDTLERAWLEKGTNAFPTYSFNLCITNIKQPLIKMEMYICEQNLLNESFQFY